MVDINCDTIAAPTNPLSWRLGSTVADGNDIRYYVKPYETRPPAPTVPQGHCTTNLVYLFARFFEIWGAGWSNSDYGLAKGGLSWSNFKGVE
jgi:hypothetical protein